ncbi:histidine phosphatase superfamily [Syncephalis fuscata]|nr:histidine phosphatase superfamily [Syncephalis fuscata]
MIRFYPNIQSLLLVTAVLLTASLLVFIHQPNHPILPFRASNSIRNGNDDILLLSSATPPPSFQTINMLMATYARYNTEIANNKTSRVPAQCSLVHLHVVARHGTRQPHRREIREFSKLEKELRTHEHKSWPKWMKDWQNPYSLSKAGQLAKQGVYDLASLAKRDVQRYQEWLGKTAEERHKHAIYSTYAVAQVIESAQSYAGVYSGHRLQGKSLHILPNHKSRDESISEACPRWKKIAEDKEPQKKIYKPYEKRYLNKVLDRLSKQLKFKVNEDFYRTAVTICTYENAIYAQHAHWCKLLHKFDSIDSSLSAVSNAANDTATSDIEDETFEEVNPLTLMDFREDLYRYFKYGNGRSINSKIAGSFLTHVLVEMKTAMKGRDKARSHLRFGHTGTILLILTQLGIYTEEPKFNDQRVFRTSHIVPFAANLHFELLSCDDNNVKGSAKNHYVRVLHNEVPIRIPGCPKDTDLCPWKKFHKTIEKRIGKSSFDEICHV